MEGYLRNLGYSGVKDTGGGGGGCISQGRVFRTDQGGLFVKENSGEGAELMFLGEKAGLEALEKTGAISVPHPLSVGSRPSGGGYMLVMTLLPDLTSASGSSIQAQLGTALATMHLSNRKNKGKEGYVSKFGFDVETCCGSIPQSNTWEESWSKFYVNKLSEQVGRLKGSDRELRELWPQLQQKTKELLDDLQVEPSLLHGDLWSGNAGASRGKPVVFDPAAFYGHSEYDLGIAGMFGGFSQSFYSAYHSLIPKEEGFDARHSLYQLFHYLNHWNHFGAGYRGQSLNIIKKLIK